MKKALAAVRGTHSFAADGDGARGFPATCVERTVGDDDLTHAGSCRRASPAVGGRLAVAVEAYPARFNGLSRQHTESDLGSFLTWCQERDLDRHPNYVLAGCMASGT